MQVREALERLDEIHDHLTKAEVYPGFRVPGVALAGVVGLVAAAAQPLVAPPDPAGFVGYWVAVAAACGLLGGGAAVHSARTSSPGGGPGGWSRSSSRASRPAGC